MDRRVSIAALLAALFLLTPVHETSAKNIGGLFTKGINKTAA